MEISHQQLRKTNSQYTGQHTLLGRSKKLIRTVQWQNQSERYLLWGGLILFCLVALYIGHKRSIYFVPYRLRPGYLLKALFRMVLKVPGTQIKNSELQSPQDPDNIDYNPVNDDVDVQEL